MLTMWKSQNEAQALYRKKVIAMLQEHEVGASVPELSRRHGVAENTIYPWKSKFGGLEMSEAKRLHELEAEHAKLKRLLAESMPDNAAPKELVRGKWWRPRSGGEVIGDAWSDYLPGSKDIEADWLPPIKCGNFNVKSGNCSGQKYERRPSGGIAPNGWFEERSLGG
jgi:putative transposase